MCLPKIWHARSVPVTFVSMIPSHVSSDTVSVGSRLILPAQLIRISTLPNSFTVPSSSACSVARSATSDVRRNALRPVASIAFAASSTCSGRRELATTSAPASASPIAIANPIPEVPPTTTADLPLRSNNGCPIENSSLLLQYRLCGQVLRPQDIRLNLVHYLPRCPVVHNSISIVRPLQRGQLTVQQFRVHVLVLPPRQPPRNQLSRPIKKYKHDMRRRHSVFEDLVILLLQCRTRQDTIRPSVIPFS